MRMINEFVISIGIVAILAAPICSYPDREPSSVVEVDDWSRNVGELTLALGSRVNQTSTASTAYFYPMNQNPYLMESNTPSLKSRVEQRPNS